MTSVSNQIFSETLREVYEANSYFKIKMKNTGIIFLTITTIILVALVIFSALNFSFPIIYFLMLVGQAFLIFSVYKILTDNYTTEKTFEDFYEDHPLDRNEH